MGAEGHKRRGVLSIRSKFALLVAFIFLPLVVINIFWNVQIQRTQTEHQAYEKASVLADEMMAAWDFVDINQDAVNRNPDGTFRKKQLVCVVAAKSISMLFTNNTEYVIRFTSLEPRQASNAADAFETEALRRFAERGETSYHAIETDAQGESVFRYAEPLVVTEHCLECHGTPVGELDQYGYAKEGMEVGDIAGAISISEPMEIYEEGMVASVAQQLFMMVLILALACGGMYLGVSFIVLRPLDGLRRAAKDIGSGNFDYALPVRRGPLDEIDDFAHDFDAMARMLKELCEDLEAKVRDQTDRFAALNELLLYQKGVLKRTLDRLNEEMLSKNNFFAIVSHELRTPLTSILAYARIILQDPTIDARTRHEVEEIETNGVLLLNLVNNILTISKTEAHKNDLVREPVDYVDLVTFVKEALEPVAKSKGIVLSTVVDAGVPVAMADWEKLRRILENLVDNAIKYTHPGGFVRIEVGFDEACDPPDVVLKVVDNGVGIDDGDLDEIFELYRQTRKQSSNRRYKGTGLGLAVVRQLAELHGGSSTVESVRKQGSTFTVRIPYVPVEVEDPDEDPSCG